MDERTWLDALEQMCREDDWYRQWLKKATELEPAYERIREKLNEADREILDQYIMACEEMDNTRQLLAYKLGRNLL